MRREDVIIPLIKGKRVLDVGSVGQSGEYCLWNLLVEHAKTVVGVDLPDAEQTAKALIGVRPEGLQHATDTRIVLGDMESISLERSFDVAVAGDVIEHVSNPGRFLDNIRRHLEGDGTLAITTPNAKWPTVALAPNPTHVLWHDRFTLRTLLERHGYQVRFMGYYHGNKPSYAFWKRPLLLRQQLICIAEVTS